jgi:hypothetical protein
MVDIDRKCEDIAAKEREASVIRHVRRHVICPDTTIIQVTTPMIPRKRTLWVKWLAWRNFTREKRAEMIVKRPKRVTTGIMSCVSSTTELWRSWRDLY